MSSDFQFADQRSSLQAYDLLHLSNYSGQIIGVSNAWFFLFNHVATVLQYMQTLPFNFKPAELTLLD